MVVYSEKTRMIPFAFPAPEINTWKRICGISCPNFGAAIAMQHQPGNSQKNPWWLRNVSLQVQHVIDTILKRSRGKKASIFRSRTSFLQEIGFHIVLKKRYNW